jgi:hypothetical protein
MIPDATFTLDKAKAHLRVVFADEDALITSMLDSAVAAVERYTRRAWTKRHWLTYIDASDLACDADTPGQFHALLSPANAVVFTGPPPVPPALPPAELPPGDYYYSSRFGHTVLNLRTWPSTGPTEGIAGYIAWAAEPPANPDGVVPPDIYAAVMLFLGDLYETREAQVIGTIVSPNPAAEMLMRPYVIDMHA